MFTAGSSRIIIARPGRPLIGAFILLTVVLASCASPTAETTPNSSAAPEASEPEPSHPSEVEEPEIAFSDDLGGNGGSWNLPLDCPDESLMAELADVSGGFTLNEPDVDTVTGCHYHDAKYTAVRTLFSETADAFAAREWDDPAKKMDAPSLGEGAGYYSDEKFEGCSVWVPRSDGNADIILVSAVNPGDDPEQGCADAVQILQAIGTQG